jgi:NADH dehydrogenase [ubiquinone] 1 alpha subcomplex assembly factor 7
MALANGAYYARRDPFADFTTAPEISQMFGELLGAWAAVCWDGIGRPDPVLLVEAGPGRGTLMADALRVLAKVAPDFSAALRLHLIETSPRLRAVQAQLLPGAVWHEDLGEVPDGPMLLIANEFLDALPIRQFVRRGDGWAERFVGEAGFVEQPAEVSLSVAAGEGQVVEYGEAARIWVEALAGRLVRQGGAALLLDYGPARSAAGESLQALRGGLAADPLAAPGEADLTAHVDFAALAAAAAGVGASVYGPVPQGALLERLGLFARTRQLAARLPAAEAMALMEAAMRLASPERMGALFKAVALCRPGLAAPPGFET